MNKIIYVANIRLPTEKAHGIQIMHMCNAFAKLGAEVELVVPRRLNPIKADPFEYYRVERNFKITRLPTIDLVQLGKFGFLVQAISFAKFVFFYLLFSARGGSAFGGKKPDIIYSRDEYSLAFLSLVKKNLFWEAHTGIFNFFARFALRRLNGIVAISNGLKRFYVDKNIPAEKIIVVHDAVDLDKFNINLSQKSARERLGLPADKKIVMYIGHFHKGKGVEVLLETSKLFNESIKVVIIGGTDEQVQKFRKYYPEVVFLGYRPYRELPQNQKAADVLVIPNTTETETSRRFTSPLKLFAHMAAERPIVASDLPSLREILSEKNAILVEPDDPQALAGGINRVLKNAVESRRIANQAYSDVQEYTWEKRSQKIIRFIAREVETAY